MRIICLVKFAPDIEKNDFDGEGAPSRERGAQVVSSDDACALGLALSLKKQNPDVYVEVVTMAPKSVTSGVEDLLRRGFDAATIISDSAFAGSDTLATSRVLGAYLNQSSYDLILTGTSSSDGDTCHVPSQLAELLGLGQMSAIIKVDEESILAGHPVVEVDNDEYLDTYELSLPAILSIERASKIRLPFVRFHDRKLDVSDRIRIVTNEQLGLDPDTVGAKGSPTRVVKTWNRQFDAKSEQLRVRADEEGIKQVVRFFEENGYL